MRQPDHGRMTQGRSTALSNLQKVIIITTIIFDNIVPALETTGALAFSKTFTKDSTTPSSVATQKQRVVLASSN